MNTAAESPVHEFEHAEGVEREAIPQALSMTRAAWVLKTSGNYWHGIPALERDRLAGLLWDRISRLDKVQRP